MFTNRCLTELLTLKAIRKANKRTFLLRTAILDMFWNFGVNTDGFFSPHLGT